MALAIGCSSDETAQCVPGKSESCACPDGARSVQVCREDGTFGRCQCAMDAGGVDAGAQDAGNPEAGQRDASPGDAGEDSRTDAGTACTPLPTDGSWTALPLLDPLPEGTGPSTPALAVTAGDSPVVAWTEAEATAGSSAVRVARWTGTEWNLLDGPLSATDSAPSRPRLALDGEDRPVVGWDQASGSVSDGYVARRVDGVWEMLGGALSAASGDTSTSIPTVAVDHEDRPLLAWVEQNDVHVRRWTGSSWAALGAPVSAIDGDTATNWPSVAVRSDGTPVLGWTEDDGTGAFEALVAEHTGGEWRVLGGGLRSLAGTTENAVRMFVSPGSDGSVLASYELSDTGEAFLQVWDGSGWELLGDSTEVLAGVSIISSHTSAMRGEVPLVALQALGDAEGIYVRRWRGGVWATLGEVVIRDVNRLTATRIAVTPCGRPFVAHTLPDGESVEVLGYER